MEAVMNDIDASYDVTKKSGSSFLYSFVFLPRQKQDAITAVYAFCRAVDDIVDEPGEAAEKQAALDAWRANLDLAYGAGLPEDPLARALMPWIAKFRLPRHAFDAVIEGCQMDISKSRYASFEELDTYIYRVASAVGLLCIEIFGYDDPRIRDYAVALGKALQLTNILRDVGKDYHEVGRIYLPADEMAKFGVSEADIANGNRTPGMIELMKLQASRARGYYAQAKALLAGSERRNMAAAEIMGSVYHDLLFEIEQRNFDVFNGEIKPPKLRRIIVAVRAWARSFL